MYLLRMMALRLELMIAVLAIVLVSNLCAIVPDCVWYPSIQLVSITLIVLCTSYYFADTQTLNSSAKLLIDNPMYCVLIASGIVLFINLLQSLFGENSVSEGCTIRRMEQFSGDANEIGTSPVILGDPFCPPKLDFNNIDSDNESQLRDESRVGEESQKQSCVIDQNQLTEQQKLDKIDIYLRDSQESIARINNYLNVSRPDERWLSKEQMDDPENKKISNNP